MTIAPKASTPHDGFSQPYDPVVASGVPVVVASHPVASPSVPVVGATASSVPVVPVVTATTNGVTITPGGAPFDLRNGGDLRRDRDPTRCICPNCNQQVVSKIDYEPGLLTWGLCGFICCIGCWIGCQFIPFCVDETKDIRHSCPRCGFALGTRHAIGGN